MNWAGTLIGPLLLACLTNGLIAVEGVFFFLFSLIPPIVFVFLLVPYTPFFNLFFIHVLFISFIGFLFSVHD